MNFLSKITHIALRQILPNRCFGCKDIIKNQDICCTDCWMKIKLVSSPMCIKCGKPMKFYLENDAICASCILNNLEFDYARSFCVYEGLARRLVLSIKNSDNTINALIVAKFLLTKFAKELESCDLVCQIPTHKRSLHARLYNQSAIILNHIKSQNHNIKTNPMLLEKIKMTKKQISLDSAGRLKNLKNAFKVRDENFLQGVKKIGIIDDVLTTGATFSEAARAIKSINKDIEVICFSFCTTTLSE